MKTRKLSFSEIQSVMSRSEMKKIMAGSGGSNCVALGGTCSIPTTFPPNSPPCCGHSTCVSGKCEPILA